MTRRTALRSIGVALLHGSASRGADARALAGRGKLTVRVDDEFGPLRVAMMHDARNARQLGLEERFDSRTIAEERGERHPEAGPLSGVKVMRQVAQLRKLLAEFRVEIIEPVPIEGATAQVFTRDPLFVVGGTAFLGSMLDDCRAVEIEGLDPTRDRLLRVVDLGGEHVVIEGGDVMVLDGGKTVLVGTNANTNEFGFEALATQLKGSGTRVLRVRHHRLHLDCCVAPLPDGSALFNGRAIAPGSLPALKEVFRKLIPLDTDEANRFLAANLLWLDPQNVVSGVRPKKTNARLNEMGYTVHALAFSDVQRMWGGFRCAVCPIRRG